jgi:predicted Zn-dependent protease
LKWFPDRAWLRGICCGVLLAGGLAAAGASHLLRLPAGVFPAPGRGFARWIEHVEADSGLEKALYRLMQLPGGEILFRRPPRETIPALTALEQTDKSVAFYSLRALQQEQALNFDAAERDWKTWAGQSNDPAAAHLDLADFYERRLKPQDELAALEFVGNSTAGAQERWTAAEAQRSWLAWERALTVAGQFALPRATVTAIYAGFVARYPHQQSLWARQLGFLLDGRDYAAASTLIEHYRSEFPGDRVFPLQAEADLAARRGAAQDGLAVYERGFDPLWPPELIRSYYALVLKSRTQQQFADRLHARLAADPADLKTAARLFYLYQQEGQLDSAKAVLNSYREKKDAAGAAWSADELDTFAHLFEGVQDIPEAARYDYALAADRSTPGAEQKGLTGLTRILLAAPEQPLRVGAGNLDLYRSIATMDRGPGYLNGILSLLLNTQGPEDEYASADQHALHYFHSAKAAELLAEIDHRFPTEPSRAQLHASLMEAYAAFGDDPAAIREGTAILAAFPQFSGRVQVAMQVADAYERTKQTEKEFALYHELLGELAARADGVPLGSESAAYSKPVEGETPPVAGQPNNGSEASAVVNAEAGADPGADSGPDTAAAASSSPGARSHDYAEVLDRYLSRLVALHRLPDALNVLRGELDRNPQDPGLYQRLADFLEQNQLNAPEETVYQRAIDQFQETGWYARLARFYLRQRRNADYRALMRKVTDIFSGTELEQFLEQAPAPNWNLAFEVNLYAHRRFPHDLRFVENLLNEYTRTGRNAEVEQLLWEHWQDSPELRDRLFELLSLTGRLNAELTVLRQQSPEIDKADWSGLATRNPAAERFWMEACLWQSHFEQGLGAADALAAAYPADLELDSRASSLYRSLAYFHPEDTDKAVAIEQNLLQADPGNLEIMATIGDIYADRGRFAEAAPFWVRMTDARPGESDGYLQSATVFWDYYDFADAQAQIEKARERLGKPTLFGYQAGAIDESRADVPDAVREYVAGAIADPPSDESRARLLALARKPELRAAIEESTSTLLANPAPTAAAIQLCAAVLDAEHRRDDLAREFLTMIARTVSFDVLDAIAASARSSALTNVEEAALRRQIALTTDPVHNLELRYQLVDFYQSHNNASAAAIEVDAIYREHARIMGVVRSTVDFDWGHDRKSQAVDVLLASSQVAYPELKDAFQLEAAQKLTGLGQYQRSRALLDALLTEKPLDVGSETAMAENYAHASDQAGLQAFYRARLDLVAKAQLDAGEKQQRIAQLRRGMITAASALGNSNEAVDQYIELINAYPDDASLTQEAALYAVAHGARDRLFDFYQKTIVASPRDPRWSLVLARLATAAEDFPLAIDAYAKTILLRPERQDLYIAQADLEIRMHRLDDAGIDYQKLYTLSYRDPQWMEKLAELRARQGRAADAVNALDGAWIAGHPPKAANSFRVAARLESWGLLDRARTYAERGLEQAGADLYVDSAGQSGAATYARILTRQRQAAAAFTRLAAARDAAAHVPLSAVVQQAAQQVVQQGPGAVTNEQWRQQHETERKSEAAEGFAQALRAMGHAAGEFYTPEEKAQFAGWLQSNCASAGTEEIRRVYLPAAEAAGLADLTAELRWNLVQQRPRQNGADLTAWIQLEEARGQTESAAERLEKLSASLTPRQRVAVLQPAADLYRKSGNAAAELRVTAQLAASATLRGERLSRYYQLLLDQNPQRLVALAASDDSATQFLVRRGSREQALAAVAARSAGQPLVWKSGYTALAGLYHADFQPEIGQAFSTALNAGATIGERISHPADRDQQMAGEVWFYYGSRYGEFLDAAKDPRAADFLPSELEHTPESPHAYVQLAAYSVQMSRSDAALTDYRNSLDLNADQPAVLDRMAVIDWQQGRQADALAAWSHAAELLAAEIDAQHVPETLWGDFAQVLGSVSAHGQYGSIQQQIDSLLRVYIKRNDYYRTQPLIEAGYRANGSSAEWLISITGSSSDQEQILESLINDSSSGGNGDEWIQKDQISTLLAHVVALEEKRLQENAGEDKESLYSAQQRLATALIAEKKFADARTLLAQIPDERRIGAAWLPAVLAVADADGTIDQLVDEWKKPGSHTPAPNDLRNAAAALSQSGRRSVMRFVYERALEMRDLSASNFLGLAAIRLGSGDAQGADELLKRLTLVSGNIDADTDAAAHLLEENHKPAEAIPFLRSIVEAAPWNAAYQVRLGAALLAVNAEDAEALSLLGAVAADQKAPYAQRLAAARELKGHGVPSSGSAELMLVSQSACAPPADAAKPFFVAAREASAACASDVKTRERLLREAVAIAPCNAQLQLRYAWAAFAAGMDSRALIAAEPLLQPGSGYGQPSDSMPDPNSESSAVPGESPVSADEAQQPVSLASLPPADAVRFSLLAIRADERRHDLDGASSIVQYALNAVHDPALRRPLEEEQKRLMAESLRETQNDQRVPDIHSDLAQRRLVKPRLAAEQPFLPIRLSAKEEQP